MTNKENIAELKKIFPEFVLITDGWLQNALIHGHKQSKQEKRILRKFHKIIKNFGIPLPND